VSDWRKLRPEWGIVLGSGLGAVVDAVEVKACVPFGAIAELPVSKVPGHAGQFIFGRLGGREVVVAQGRVHLYEGHSAAAVAAGVRFLAERGVRRLVLTNAAGTLNPAFAPGTWMMLSDHLNLTGTSPLLGDPHFLDLSDAYSATLRAAFREAASALEIPLHEGVYAGLPGPQYETPAEVRMLRTLGADAVGMSTVHETIQARALGVEVAAFSCLTNWAAGLSPAPLAHSEVLDTGRAAAGLFARLIARVLETRAG
jgi:purine-nucleoside phosphorylase